MKLIRFNFSFMNLWVGAYYSNKYRRRLFINFLPMLGIVIEFPKRARTIRVLPYTMAE